jgi:hypothetical protein
VSFGSSGAIIGDFLNVYYAIAGEVTLTEWFSFELDTVSGPLTIPGVGALPNGTYQMHARLETAGGSLGDLSNEIIVVIDTEDADVADMWSSIHVSSPWRTLLPQPTGTVGAAARKTFIGLYGDI